METTSHNNEVLQDRLNRVRKAVHKATQDAWKQANGHSLSFQQQQQQQNHKNLDENNTASFMLGMDLFGNTTTVANDGDDGVVAVTSVLEQSVREKLDQVEKDLKRLQHEISIASTNGLGDDRDTYEEDDYAMREAEYDDEDDELQRIALSRQIESYKAKVAFLKQASFARSCIEESASLSSPALNVTKEPDLVSASQKLLQALDEVDVAERILQEAATGTPNEVQVANQILSSLRHQVRRHRVHLVHKTTAILDNSFDLTASSITMKSSEQLEKAYHVLEILGGLAPTQTKTTTKSTALEDSMHNLTLQLFRKVFKPILEAAAANRYENNAQPCCWNVEETSDKRATLIGVSTSATRKGNKIHRIEWNVVEQDNSTGRGTQSIPEGDNEDEEEDQTFPSVMTFKNMLTTMQQILVFVQTKVLLERDVLCELVGTQLFGRPNAMPSSLNLPELGLESILLGDRDRGVLMEAWVEWIRDHCLKEALLFDDLLQVSSMQQQLFASTLPVCEDLENRKLIPCEHPSKIILFCEMFERKYVDHRRCILLNEARDILTNNDYHNTVVVGVDENPLPKNLSEEALAVFNLSKCSISDTASRIMTLIRRAMDDAVAIPNTISPDSVLSLLRPTLYRTAREMLSLFRAIIPSSHGQEIANVPRTAAVLHNDAVYFAHNCLTLGLEYREKFPPVDEVDTRGRLLKQTCIFVDMVPLFREMADSALGDMMDLQKGLLAEIVGSRISLFGQAMRSDESLQEWSEAETGLAAGTYHLRHLAQTWKPILSPSTFLRAIGFLVDVVLSLYLNQIASANYISPAASQFAGGLFQKAAVDIIKLMESEAHVSKFSMEWGRFRAVSKFLGFKTLFQVEEALPSGVFVQLASQELIRLVLATFPADSSHRRSILQSISSVN
ncbi:centromere/kinetochore Zw10-domain containing protein [Nitzschia inconspicua]|uniref:Centromere/kinetochore Zw10-domain containing protein n=1 Tax=Nitzschia inconspicua TaxID=303405 RepID=A0A9K3PCE9_9STRA|nr:centromere/kinetochore Zw10-domain containing protein [Nitzschia inconspicua]